MDNDTRWYLADIVLEHIILGNPRNVVHVNTHLIKARTPDEAYRKALALGRSKQSRYLNTDRRMVRVAFRGLRELVLIHDRIEDGVELMWEESVGVSPTRLRKRLRAKASLAVFAPVKARARSRVPNYMPESVMKQLESAGIQRFQLGFGSAKAHRSRTRDAGPR